MIAKILKKDDIVVFEIIKGGGATAVYHAINSDDVDRIMQHPMTSIASDGPITVFGVGSPHPRTYGTFARVLGSYVRERNILSLEEAVRKMTSLLVNPPQKTFLCVKAVLGLLKNDRPRITHHIWRYFVPIVDWHVMHNFA